MCGFFLNKSVCRIIIVDFALFYSTFSSLIDILKKFREAREDNLTDDDKFVNNSLIIYDIFIEVCPKISRFHDSCLLLDWGHLGKTYVNFLPIFI